MNEMQTVKRHFFALRNGIIADTLRKAGSPYRIIFGLNLPQLIEVASKTPHSVELADALHANSSTRCSRLMAPMIHPPEEMTAEKALSWMTDCISTEEADILCHRLLRRLPFAGQLCRADNNDSKWLSYARLRLWANLNALGKDAPKPDFDTLRNSEHNEIAALACMLAE